MSTSETIELADRPLLSRTPRLAAIPHVRLASLPTPVRPAPELARRSPFREVWIKCDDVTGERYGGNKVRKLEFLLGHALSRDAHRVWTVGGVGSNHCLATATYATELGLTVDVRHFPQLVTPAVRLNCLAVAARGARLSLGPRWSVRQDLRRTRWRYRRHDGRDRLYAIPAGGSTPIGALGYVNAALELAEQVVAGELPRIDIVYVAAGTAGTLVGLHVGFQLAGLDVRVVGVRVIERTFVSQAKVERLTRGLWRLLGSFGVRPSRLAAGSWRLDDSQLGAGYGRPTAAGEAAVRLGADLEELALDSTYTGKAMAALLAAPPHWAQDRNALFVATYNTRPVDALVPPYLGVGQLPRPYRRLLNCGARW